MNNDYKNFNTILDQARSLISVQFEKRERRKVLPNKINCILRKKRIEGMANSGPELRAVRDACEEEIDKRAKIAWASIKRAHKALGSHITNTLAEDLKQEIRRYIENIVQDVSELMAKRLRLTEPNDNLGYFEKTKSEVKEEYDAEVDIYVAFLKNDVPQEKDRQVKKTIPFYEPEVHVRSKAWNDHYTKEDFDSAENVYGKLAENIQQLAQRINDLIGKFTKILTFLGKDEERDELWYVPKLSEVSNILIFSDKNDERGELWYVPTQLVKSVMNIHFSALNIKIELELLLTEQEAKLFFNRLRKNLALTDSGYADEKIGSVYAWYGKQEAEALVKQLGRFSALQTLTSQGKNPPGQKGKGEKGKTPSDLIDLAKAVGLYHRSRAQIKRDIEEGKIKDYRKIEKGKHWISRSEADDLYIPK